MGHRNGKHAKEGSPMKATVYFVELSKAQVETINGPIEAGGGWGAKVGTAYLAAQAGKIDASNFDMLVRVADVRAQQDNPEAIWVALQNGIHSNSGADAWTDSCAAGAVPEGYVRKVYGTGKRSMSVGDIIVWEDGIRVRVADTGFETIETISLVEKYGQRV